MKWLALLSLIAANLVRQQAPVLVRVRSGLVRGRISENGKVYEYLGIAYATVDETNRFQAPLPPPKWDGIFEARDENMWCPQPTVLEPFNFEEPNCLKLNIYTPIHTSAKLLPVMVFIHGGCFFQGSSAPFLYGGGFLAEQDVVYVGINYRLSVEGFLCLGIKEAPGNAGLKDQLAALRWIRDNIHAFGGNKNDVTLFGESAGAVSTSLMILSPAAKGLFHKAIIQSGSTLAPWALQHDPIKIASNLVKILGYDTEDPYEIHSILSNKTVHELMEAMKQETIFCVTDKNIFVPCVEKQIDGIEPIITDNPAEIIQSRNYTKVPMIIGHNDDEGMYFVAGDYGTSLRNGTRHIDPSTALQTDLVFPSESHKNRTADEIKQFYFSNPRDDKIMDMVNFYSDLYFKFPLLMEAEMYSRTTDQPMYYYLFKYTGLINLAKIRSRFSLGGASHADELFYMFKPHLLPTLNGYLESDMMKKMLAMWTNFAKFSDPTPKATRLLPIRWRPSRESNPNALVIDAHLSTAPLWDERVVAFWNETYNRYGRRNYAFKNKYNCTVNTTSKKHKTQVFDTS